MDHPNPSALDAPPHVLALLARLHAESLEQERNQAENFAKVLKPGGKWDASADAFMQDKFVALEPDKCEFLYLLARSINAKNIVEVGTSFGVSTIYLALAVSQNVKTSSGANGKVIGTEKDQSKAARARKHWAEAGDEITKYIELREGDLIETLNVEDGMPEKVDLVLLDIWAELALPALKILLPRLRSGCTILTDNTAKARDKYKDLFDFIHDPENGFKCTTVPYTGGLEVIVYLPPENWPAASRG